MPVEDSKVVKYTFAKKVGNIDTLAPELEFLLICSSDNDKLAQRLLKRGPCCEVEGTLWKKWERWLDEKKANLQTLYPAFDIQPSLREMIFGMLEPDYRKRLTIDEAARGKCIKVGENYKINISNG